MLILTKILIVALIVVMLRSSQRFQSMSREMDESAMTALKKFMYAAEEYGFPPQIIPWLMLLTALTFMFSQVVTTPVGR